MATLPFTPADAKALIPDPSSTLCGNFTRALLKLPVLFYQMINTLFDSSGNPTKALVNSVMATGDLEFSACLQTEDGTRLLCDGRDISQTAYPDLYAKITTLYGASTAGNFKLPDFRDRFPVGVGSTIANAPGLTGGEKTHVLTTAELPAHDHKPDGTHSYLLKAPYAGSITGSDTVNSGSEQAVGPGDGAAIASVGSGTAHNTLPPYLSCYVYVRT